jgi:hypothetical protein
MQRRPKHEKPKAVPTSSISRRELPRGYVFDDEEVARESEPDETMTTFVDEQEQSHGQR